MRSWISIEGNKEYELCGNECESVSQVFGELSAYSSSRVEFAKDAKKWAF